MKIEANIHYLFVRCRKIALNNRKNINKAFAGLLTIIGLFSALPLFSDKWRDIFLLYWDQFITNLPGFLAYFYDPRAFILYIVGIFLFMRLIYFKYEVRFLELAIKNKRDLAIELPKIKQACPSNHFLGLIIGKLNERALEVKDRRGADIISTIDKNIKKYERVYWISEDEIGVIFYEINTKDETDFITYIIKNKLRNEIGEEDATIFLDNILFTMIRINKGEELYSIESRARSELLKKQAEQLRAASVKIPANANVTI